jgi:predicted NUDIX family phosphoesterase
LTGSTPQSTAEHVAKLVLSIIEDELDEEVLSIDRDKIKKYFATNTVIQAETASQLVKDFSDSGNYLSRELVEKDLNRVQALPVVVIKNRSGKILQLKRKEKDTKNVLHEQLVIWAGGHVRKEDSANGSTLLNCAVRELQEELRLRVSPADLKLMGAVYHQTRPGLIKHMAIVYEWQAESDEVDVVLNGEAFFERRGSSQSGQFVGITDLQACLDSDKVVEEWSVSIIKELMSGAEFLEPQTALFS